MNYINLLRDKLNSKGFIEVYVKPNCSKTKITKYDDSKEVFYLELGAKAERNLANIELIKFLRKNLPEFSNRELKIFGTKSKHKKVFLK